MLAAAVASSSASSAASASTQNHASSAYAPHRFAIRDAGHKGVFGMPMSESGGADPRHKAAYSGQHHRQQVQQQQRRRLTEMASDDYDDEEDEDEDEVDVTTRTRPDHQRMWARKTSDGQQRLSAPAPRNKMERGISKASENECIVNEARSHVENHFGMVSGGRGSPDSPDSAASSAFHAVGVAVPNNGSIDTPVCAFTLPDLMQYPDDFRAFLEKDLIELSSLISLEQSGCLNWWAETGTCQRLWPLATTGDGNCLLHAASLGMWGFHDRLLTLRKALHAFLSAGECASAIYRRWRWESHLQNLQFGLTLSEREWQDEWRSVLRLASSEPRHGSTSASSESSMSTSSSGSSSAGGNASSTHAGRRWSRLSVALGDAGADTHTMYESLEEVHVLALAHILRRPIIVVADTVLKDMNGDALAPIPFGGVYLPLERAPQDCDRSPLLLTYNAGHFSALVSMQQPQPHHVPAVIPLTDSGHNLLRLHFAVDPGEDFVWNHDEFSTDIVSSLILHPSEQLELLNGYLEIVKVALPDWYLEPACLPSPQPPPKQSVAKQLGVLKRKLKKNLGRLTRNSSFKCGGGNGSDERDGNAREARQQQQQQQPQQQQPFILAALLHTNKPLPYQNEMIENYLQEARRRFDADSAARARQREEDLEAEEKRRRDIFLNGYSECTAPGCYAQATPDMNYLCPQCYAQQNSKTSATEPVSCPGNSKFYVSAAVAAAAGKDHCYELTRVSASSPTPPTQQWRTQARDRRPSGSETPRQLTHFAEGLRVELPPSGGTNTASSSVRSCRSAGCEFYGTPEFDYFCSKCFLKTGSGRGEARGEARAEARNEVRTEARTEARAGARPEPRTGVRSEVLTEARVEARPEARAGARTEAKTEARTEARAKAATATARTLSESRSKPRD